MPRKKWRRKRCSPHAACSQQRYPLPVAVACVILACSLAIYFLVVNVVRDSNNTAEKALAAQVSGDIVQSFSSFFRLTKNVAAGFERPEDLPSERVFADIAAAVLAPFASTFVLMWTPRVLEKDRAAYELDVMKNLNGSIRSIVSGEYWVIKDRPRVVDGDVVVVYRGNESVYYPVRYLATKGQFRASAATVFNLDTLALEPARRDALVKAIEDDKVKTVISASLEFKLLGQLGGAILTVTSSGTGAVRLGFLYKDLFQHVLNTVERQVHCFLRISDATPLEPSVALISGELTPTGVRNTKQGQGVMVPSQYKSDNVALHYEVGGRTYLFEFYFVINYAAFASTTAIAAGLLVCVTLSCAFCGYIARIHHLRSLQAIELAKVQTSKKTQDRLVNYVCHEMRNPVHVIKFCSHRLETYGFQPEILKILRVNANQLGSLVDGWLDISKSLHVPLALSFSTVDVIDLVKECFTEFKLVYAELKPTVTWKLEVCFSEKSLHVVVDKLRFRQVVVNGLTNAIKYTESGTILVRVRAEALPLLSSSPQNGGRRGLKKVEDQADRVKILVEIRDSGKGVSEAEADQATLFYEFKQGSARNTDIPSTGLGLSIARHLARLMDGDVTLRNTSTGNGAEFAMWVAAEKGMSVGAVKSGKEAQEGKDGNLELGVDAARVYVCDDDYLQLSLVKRMLDGVSGVYYATGVDEMMKTLSESGGGRSRRDVIVTDIHLGQGLTGFDLVKALRERGLVASVVACSADVSAKGDLEEYLRAGFVDVLAKPYSKSRLIMCINKAAKSPV